MRFTTGRQVRLFRYPSGVESHQIELDLPAEASLAAVAAVAAEWGARWEPDGWGGRLTLPVVAGLRRGKLIGRVHARAQGKGTRLSLDIDSERLTVNRPAVAVLAGGGAGGLAVALWPFWPPLLGLVPLGAVLALSAWFLVTSRLRHAGAAEFLQMIVDQAHQPAETDS